MDDGGDEERDGGSGEAGGAQSRPLQAAAQRVGDERQRDERLEGRLCGAAA